jgi:Tfp pilus assembly major pilin PilA
LSAALAAALVAGPLVQSVTAQTAATPAPAAVTDKKDKSKMSSATAAMRERQKKCGAEREGGQGRRQSREGHDPAEILERLQQAPQGSGRQKELMRAS